MSPGIHGLAVIKAQNFEKGFEGEQHDFNDVFSNVIEEAYGFFLVISHFACNSLTSYLLGEMFQTKYIAMYCRERASIAACEKTRALQTIYQPLAESFKFK